MYRCSSQGCPNHKARLPEATCIAINHVCFLCNSPLEVPPVTALAVVQKINTLPGTIQLMPKLRHRLQDDNVTLDSIVDIIKRDGPLTSQIIKLASAMSYISSGQGRSLDDALSRVGVDEAYKLVSIIVSDSLFYNSNFTYDFSESYLWEKSIVTAFAMYRMAEIMNENKVNQYTLDSSLAYTIGLLHMIGMTAIDHFNISVGIPRLKGAKLKVSEEYRLLEFTNMEIAALILEKWGFSNEVFEPIKFQCSPSSLRAGSSLTLCTLLQTIRDFIDSMGDDYKDKFEFAPIPKNKNAQLLDMGTTTSVVSRAIDYGIKNLKEFKVSLRSTRKVA